jgi:predicted nucleic acid-binding protein
MTHLLDSSAFFAYFFGEPGRPGVEALFQTPAHVIGLSVLTASEFWGRLKRNLSETAFEQEWEDHLPLFSTIVPVTWEITQKAIALRRAATSRLPTIDSLIAATAAVQGAILVHCDPHFRAIPGDLLRQEFLE